MKKTLLIILIFALIMGALFALSSLYEKYRPADTESRETQSPAETETENTAEAMDIAGATTVSFRSEGVSVRGSGAAVSGQTLTVVYPGTYVLSGDYQGCVLVDCEAEQPVYLVLAGVNISNGSGPAIYIKNAHKAEIYLSENTENSLSDGAVYQTYTDSEGQPEEKQPDAVLYSADSLSLSGQGALTLTAAAANALHSRDELVISGGSISAECRQDGIEAADGVEISGGSVTLICGDDGIGSSKGVVAVNGGTLRVTCGGDAFSAAESVDFSDGSITVTACREGAEAPLVSLSGGTVTVTADKCALCASMGDVDSGLSAEDCAVLISGGTLYALAPCGIQSDGSFIMSGGAALLRSSAESEPLESARAQVQGGTLFMTGDFEQSILSADGGVNGVYYRSDSEVDGGQVVSLSDAEGNAVFALTPNESFYAVMIVYGGIVRGRSYSLSCGGQSASFTPETWMTQAVVASSRGGFGGFPGRP